MTVSTYFNVFAWDLYEYNDMWVELHMWSQQMWSQAALLSPLQLMNDMTLINPAGWYLQEIYDNFYMQIYVVIF